MDEARQMAVLKDTKNLYQYFDATAQVEYLYGMRGRNHRRDRVHSKIVDMPDKRASLLVRLIMQNSFL